MKQYCIEISIIEWDSKTNKRKALPNEKKIGVAMLDTLKDAKDYLNDLVVEKNKGKWNDS